ncbi:peptidyl-tRNA hydrolase, putative [Talaromyces stipitatus ATCC 10500]|uniref:Peptidyl-tRNA hydrolase, putative n=1 Tax=Talaromyces stipitatus (strain ATCC 10500 / CBS 375.48 / QM 6759 / NRRL 1006) TaxID=441959 RepID=B8MDM9_TALSN|nr:peptidyl-tRNA hydrolase, putative [Talaromyces stipitatus ATCC 10500]EED18258.1 peptidyl-tRNA hydrolase, putative [Talaromyces stipitatus ATCC 10500]
MKTYKANPLALQPDGKKEKKRQKCPLKSTNRQTDSSSSRHLLLDAIQPYLHERVGLSSAGTTAKSSKSIFYSTWKSPSLMNVSGPPVLRQFKTWLADRRKYFDSLSTHSPEQNMQLRLLKSSSESITIDTRGLTQRFRPTLVILHDELEARPGQIKIRREGPQQASVRGHKGLISIMESLRGAGLLSSSSSASKKSMAILRIGVGIGRPESRERNAVADYVLSNMGVQEMQALREAVPEVVEVLVQEMYRRDDDEIAI